MRLDSGSSVVIVPTPSSLSWRGVGTEWKGVLVVVETQLRGILTLLTYFFFNFFFLWTRMAMPLAEGVGAPRGLIMIHFKCERERR